MPIAGSAYTYGYATLGEFIAWIIGWDLILEYALGAATVAVGWSGHLVSFLHDFLGVDIPGIARRGAVHAGDGGGLQPRGDLQPAGGAHHAGRHGPDRHRHQGIGARQHRDRHHQGGGRADRHPRRRSLRQPRELAALHPAEHRHVRRVRLERHPPRRGRDLLRLHRLRRRVGRGAGSQEPAEGHAGRHPRVARRLHDSLRPGVGRDGGPGALQGDAGLARADGGRDSRGRSGVGRQLACSVR